VVSQLWSPQAAGACTGLGCENWHTNQALVGTSKAPTRQRLLSNANGMPTLEGLENWRAGGRVPARQACTGAAALAHVRHPFVSGRLLRELRRGRSLSRGLNPCDGP
jgi:hypothetical protein